MANKTKYTEEQFDCARTMLKKGHAIRYAAEKCGFKSTTPIQYHVLNKKEAMLKRARSWHSRNPERKKAYDIEYCRTHRRNKQDL